MKYKSNIELLDLPEYFKFGIELEANNVRTKDKNGSGLYMGKSAKYITDRNWHMAKASEESLVSHGGAELVSPILDDSESTWKTLSEICEHMKEYPGDNGNSVVTDEKCGLHIHFDAEKLSQNPKIMQNFLRLYAESEELLYKMCNDIDDPVRKGAINKDFKGASHLVSSLWRNGMAAPTGKRILKQIENGTLKLSYKKFGKLRTLASNLKLDERRYRGLNLTNIGNNKKNTIEFRMANGTLNPEVIKQTVFLYASLIDTSVKMTQNPESYKEKLEEFYKTDLTEDQKAINFLNLIMKNEQDKEIFMQRYLSVKSAPVFAKNHKKGFAKNRFQREEFKTIYDRTSQSQINDAFLQIRKTLEKSKEGDIEYAR